MRWRVRFYCGHIQEVACLLSETRPHSAARCRECGKDPSVIVAFEPIGPLEELPSASPASRRNTHPRRAPVSRRTKAELEEENAALRAEVESLRKRVAGEPSPE
jgi:hypothetical protein